MGMSRMREAIEQTIQNCSLERTRFHEAPKGAYEDILSRIERTFVYHGGPIHWSNLENRFNPRFLCRTNYIGDNYLWFEQLSHIIPNPAAPLYALFEDDHHMRTKYWVYEGYLKELIVILRETPGISDYYIVSKKMDWLISECHEDVACFVGESLKMKLLKPGGGEKNTSRA